MTDNAQILFSFCKVRYSYPMEAVLKLPETHAGTLIDRTQIDRFSSLFEQYHQQIHALAYRMVGNREDASDIVQQTFFQALRSANGFREECKPYTWLYAIARNQCLRLLENKKHGSIESLDSLIRNSQAPVSTDEFSDLERQHYIEQVKEGCLLSLLRCLTRYQRLAFILHTLLGMKTSDVAAILEKSETATRLLVHRARKRILEFLCKNCACYRPGNPCHCENLIHYSLGQGWIDKYETASTNTKPYVPAEVIESEINEIKRIALLYGSVNEGPLPESAVNRIQVEIRRQQLHIF